EIGVAEAAHVEARCEAPVGGFGIEAGYAACEGADVLASREQRFELLPAHRRYGNRHVLDVFLAPLRRDHYLLEDRSLLRLRTAGGNGESCCRRGEDGDTGEIERFPAGCTLATHLTAPW